MKYKVRMISHQSLSYKTTISTVIKLILRLSHRELYRHRYGSTLYVQVVSYHVHYEDRGEGAKVKVKGRGGEREMHYIV